MRSGPDSSRYAVAGVLLNACLLFMDAPCSAAAPSFSNAPHFSLSPRALYDAVSAAKSATGSDIDLVEVQESHVFDGDGSDRFTRYSVFKILTPAGARALENSFAVLWSPWRDDRPSMKARVVTADGQTYALDPATIAESPLATTSSIYSDARVLRAPLPSVAAGVVVETEIVMRERPSFMGAGKVDRSLLQQALPVRHQQVTLQAPSSLGLHFRVDAAPELQPTHAAANGIERWTFSTGPAPATNQTVSGLPGDVYAVPMITFSISNSWHQLAEAYSRIVASKLEGANVSDLVARLTNGRASREAKMTALVEYMNREIRYTGVEFSNASVIPHSPADTLARKYGDCKDKSLLLIALLRAAGIPANMALLNVGSQVDLIDDVPGFDFFDHAIVYVPGKPALWIDATTATARLGQLPGADRGRRALVIDPATIGLTRVDEAASTENRLEQYREIRMADLGPANLTETFRPRGTFEMRFRSLYADINSKISQEDLDNYVKSEFDAERLEKVEAADPQDLSQPYWLKVRAEHMQHAGTQANDAVVYLRPDNVFGSLPAELRTRQINEPERNEGSIAAKKRNFDYLLAEPFVCEFHYLIVPPSGFEQAVLPESVTLALGPAQFSEHFATDAQGVVHADFRFDTVKRRFTPAEQTAMRNAVADLLDREAIAIRFDLKAHLLLSKGELQESFRAYRQMVVDDPKDPIRHLRRANALIEAGLGEAARSEATLAANLDPKSAVVQENLARVLQYDLVGRWQQSGADFAGAAAAYRRARVLDPTNTAVAVEYAMLLEYNTSGVRYGPGADLTGAIAEYRKLTSEQLMQAGASQNLPYALFYARDFGGALQAASSLEEPPLSILIACEARLNGVQRALEIARRRTTSTQQFNEMVTVAGRTLMNVRDYSNAAALLEAGAWGAATAQTLAMVTMLRKAKRHEDLTFNAGPEDAVRRMLGAISVTSSTGDLGAYLSRNARAEWVRLASDERAIPWRSATAYRLGGERGRLRGCGTRLGSGGDREQGVGR